MARRAINQLRRVTMNKKFEIKDTPFAVAVEVTVRNEEQALYDASRALKFKAREMRKKRVEREQKAENDLLKKKEEILAAHKKDNEQYKKDLDNRIRNAMLEFANVLKRHDLAIDAPTRFDHITHKSALTVIDTSKSDPARSGRMIKIRTMWNGFNWD